MFVDLNHEIYPDRTWKNKEHYYDVINLGSSGGKWAFDYTGLDIKALNWAQQPQTLLEDYNLLRNFHSVLRRDGYVLITIMPFTSLNKQTGIYDSLKYVKLDTQGQAIEPHLYKQACRLAEYPILFKKSAIKAIVKYLVGKDKAIIPSEPMLEYNPMSEEELEVDAKRWIDGWKSQFGISDFNAPLTCENQKGREYRIEMMRSLIDFCLNHRYTPIYVIPPVTLYLSKYYTKEFEETYVYGFLKQVGKDITILDYSKSEDFQDSSLYFNSFFLNKKGRKLFTHRVLVDIGLID